ncbi:plasmid mobilization protein [Roseibium album]|uniref:plasmid mobilization protein n=1 Tax=Roseibium album TaxID=311410 RepID=UPI00329A623C
MTEITKVFESSARNNVQTGSKPAKGSKKRTSLSPLTLRLTVEERAKLEELAVGMTLSAYIRACVFNEEAKRRKRRPSRDIEDKKAAAEVLALLGQSRIASNLNQLAYHANCGVLEIGKNERAQIAEANVYLADIRWLLMRALGSQS